MLKFAFTFIKNECKIRFLDRLPQLAFVEPNWDFIIQIRILLITIGYRSL